MGQIRFIPLKSRRTAGSGQSLLATRRSLLNPLLPKLWSTITRSARSLANAAIAKIQERYFFYPWIVEESVVRWMCGGVGRAPSPANFCLLTVWCGGYPLPPDSLESSGYGGTAG
jgi:hypothetical protein